MKQIAVVAGAMLVLMGVGIAGAQQVQPAGKEAVTQTVKNQTVCPVMGGQVNTNLFADFDGKRVYFCCKGCPAEFQKDPATYIAKLEKDGVTLDKAPATDPTKKQTTDAKAVTAPGCAAMQGGGCCK